MYIYIYHIHTHTHTHTHKQVAEGSGAAAWVEINDQELASDSYMNATVRHTYSLALDHYTRIFAAVLIYHYICHYMCPHTTTYVCMCPHSLVRDHYTRIFAAVPTYHKCVLIPLYMYVCVLILLVSTTRHAYLLRTHTHIYTHIHICRVYLSSYCSHTTIYMEQLHAVNDVWIVPIYMLAGPYIYVYMCMWPHTAIYAADACCQRRLSRAQLQSTFLVHTRRE